MPNDSTNSYKIGDIDVIAVSDGTRTAPLAQNFVTNTPYEDVKKSFAAGGWPEGQVVSYFTPVVIKTGGKTILVDTGMGEAAGAAAGSTVGHLIKNLASVGIKPEDIDTVVISHFHPDHVNGLVGANGGPAFPKAEINVPEKEWAFWTNDAEMAKAPKGRMEDLFKNNRRVFDPLKSRVTTHAWDKEVAPGVMAAGTPGHSIGHTSYVISRGGESVYLIQDVVNHPILSLRNPGYHAMFDQDPVQAEATRRKILDMLVANKMPVQAFHFTFPGRATIEKDGNAYKAVPIG